MYSTWVPGSEAALGAAQMCRGSDPLLTNTAHLSNDHAELAYTVAHLDVGGRLHRGRRTPKQRAWPVQSADL